MIGFSRRRAATLLALTLSLNAWSAPLIKRADEPTTPGGRPVWLLGGFLSLSEQQPRRLVRIAEKLFNEDRLRLTTIEPSYAFDWQNRLAMVSALSQLFDPSPAQARIMGKESKQLRSRARDILSIALNEDPSLLVRDGAVESIRRIVRMRPTEGRLWKTALETAFLDSRNHIEGEGLFIRETILTALHEASLRPSNKVKKAAERDLNPQVRDLLRSWRTSAYDDIE